MQKDVANQIRRALFAMFRGDSQEPEVFDQAIFVLEEFTKIEARKSVNRSKIEKFNVEKKFYSDVVITQILNYLESDVSNWC